MQGHQPVQGNLLVLPQHPTQSQGELELLNIPSYQPGHRLLVIHTALLQSGDLLLMTCSFHNRS